MFPNTPIINPDGTQSSERTITLGISVDGKKKQLVIPTIVVNGTGYLVKVSNKEAFSLYRKGLNPAVGLFNTVPEAEEFVKQRSAAGGRFSKPEVDVFRRRIP